MNTSLIKNELLEATTVLQAFIENDQNIEQIEKAAELLANSLKQDGKILACRTVMLCILRKS